MGKDGRFPNRTGKEMKRILRRLCGPPVRENGSHQLYRLSATGGQTMFSYHDSATVNGGIVRQILVRDLHLTQEEARKEL